MFTCHVLDAAMGQREVYLLQILETTQVRMDTVLSYLSALQFIINSLFVISSNCTDSYFSSFKFDDI